jgi:hypothetical protein
MALASFEAKPYKGWASYQAEDSRLFFGRDREAEQVISQILSSRFTLLHATSGAGKTSLLNARVIPLLEARGWTPLRIELLNDPVDAVRVATLHSLLPPPQAEAAALKRALAELSSPVEDPSLEQLLTVYAKLRPASPVARTLLRPLEGYTTPDSVALPDFGKVLPYFCRLLRGSVSWCSFNEHLTAISAFSDTSHSGLQVNGATRAHELLELLSSKPFVEAYESLVEALYLPLPDLQPFFENLIEVYGCRRSSFSLVLVFDQFEELFTRFVDPGPVAKEAAVGLQDWRLRWELLRQLELLYQGEESEMARGEQPLLPIRFVLSMRDEFVAKLDPIRRFVPYLDRSSFHLALLGLAEAQEAIQRPAAEYGYQYSPECYTKIIEQLSIEGRYVEPIHIQIVCDKLWSVRGRHLASEDPAADRDEHFLPAIDLEVFEGLDESRGILRSFFQELIEGMSEDEKLETLEMLQPLITPSGTRNIVAWDQLVAIPFRDRLRREDLLARLLKSNVVRAERRLGGRFVEITHEFLISPIQDAIREKLTGSHEYGRFLDALRALEMAQHRGLREGTASPVPEEAVKVLARSQGRLDLGYLGSELLLRSALLTGQDKGSLATWADLVAGSGPIPAVADLMEIRGGPGNDRRLFAQDELEVIDRERARLVPGKELLERLLRSALVQAGDGEGLERELVRYWIWRAMRHEA